MLINKIVNRLKSYVKCLYIKLFESNIIFTSSSMNHSIAGLIMRISQEGQLVLGNNLSVRSNVIFNVSSNGILEIGNNVFINDGTKINVREKITIGDGVIMGQNIMIYDHDHDYKSDNFRNKFVTGPIIIGENTWIGSNVIILKNVKIGKKVTIAAGSVIHHDIPDNFLYYDKRIPNMKEIERGT